jgi:hypothetical protein
MGTALVPAGQAAADRDPEPAGASA